jgi:hypothetical protein
VAASDQVGAARDLVAPVNPGFVYPSGDVHALAALLKNALADRARLASLRSAAVAHMQTWSPERNIAATFEAIDIAVSRKRSRYSAAQPEPAPSHSAPAASQKIHE